MSRSWSNGRQAARSGAVNADAAFTLRCTASAELSTYAGIVRLAKAAGARPTPGALLQEGIDATVILNALRALRGGASVRRWDHDVEQLVTRYAGEHAELGDTLTSVRQAVDQLTREGPSPAAWAGVRRAHDLLEHRLLPHEQARRWRR